MDLAVPPSFLCPIYLVIMRDPVTCTDGHSYERVGIQTWLESNNTSPQTGAPLSCTTLTPNHALRNSIEEWLGVTFKLVPRTAVTFNENDLIARGSYKEAFRGTLRSQTIGGTLRSQTIAVLRMRVGGSCEEEAATLVKLGRHKGLVKYLGICTEGPQHLLLTEFAPHGSLDT
jgi:hypothetical protein